MTAYNGHTIYYEGQNNDPTNYPVSGNPTNWYNGSTYTNLTWTKGRQLSSLTKGSTGITYAYDMNGIRSAKTVGTEQHTYLTQNGQVVRETIGTGSTAKILDFVYDNNGQPFALCYSTNNGQTFTDYFYVTNLQGDVVRLINSAGSTIANYSYDAWGDLLSVTNSSGSAITSPSHIANLNPLRYRGYYYDTDTGWYYLQSRYYDPEVGRFINADLPGYTAKFSVDDNNMFVYCSNNPIFFKDDGGMQKVAIIFDDRGGDNEFLANYAKVQQNIYFGNGDTVVMFPVSSADKFASAWDSLGNGKYDHVDILCHGAPGILGFGEDGGRIGNNTAYSKLHKYDALGNIKINKSINLYSCNGGTNYLGGESVAQNLAYKSNAPVTAVVNACCYFSTSGKNVLARLIYLEAQQVFWTVSGDIGKHFIPKRPKSV